MHIDCYIRIFQSYSDTLNLDSSDCLAPSSALCSKLQQVSHIF